MVRLRNRGEAVKQLRTIVLATMFVAGGLMLCRPAPAQTAATGALTGIVSDPSSAAISGAAVTVVNSATGISGTAVTATSGVYRFPFLLPGTYSARVTASGFKTNNFPKITIKVTETSTLNISLEVGAVSQVVQVHAEAALAQTESVTLGQNVSGTEITDLPLTNRNYTQVLALSAGVGGDVFNGAEMGKNTQDMYVNGMRTLDNNYQMDGAPINNFGTGRAGDFLAYNGIAIPNPDAIQEFQIQTSLYDAGYGRNAGANVDVVTKSGSNSFHGDTWEFFRNEALNANDFFLNEEGQPRGILRQNQFGGTLGGPIKKDKAFFFFSYQGTRQLNGLGSSSLSSTFLPPLTNDRSAAALGKIACGQSGYYGGVAVACDGSNINPVALNLLNRKFPNGQFVIPNPQTIMSDGTGFSVYSIPSRFAEDQFVGNIDYHVGDEHTLIGRYFFSRDPAVDSFTGPSVPGFGITKEADNENLVLKLTSTFSPRFVNVVTGSFSRELGNTASANQITNSAVGITPDSSPLLPIISVAGSFQVGGTLNDGFTTSGNEFTISDDISTIHGNHSIRMGFVFQRDQDNINDDGIAIGTVNFLSFPDFLLGESAAQNGSQYSNVFSSIGEGGNHVRGYRVNSTASFIQDDWKVRRNLTVNLGVRWDINGAISENHGVITNFSIPIALAGGPPPPQGTLLGYTVPSNFPQVRDKTLPAGVIVTDNKTTVYPHPLHNFGPRIGLAWSPFARSNHFVIRAGYGIYYSKVTGDWFAQLLSAPPYSAIGDLAGVGNASATFQNPLPPLTAGWTPRSIANPITFVNVPTNTDSPMDQQFSLNTQYEILPNTLLQVGYVGSRATRIEESRPDNQPLLASPTNPVNGITTNTVENASLRVPVLGATPFSYDVETYGWLWYNSLQTTLTKRMSHGLQIQAAYTFSKTLDTESYTYGSNSIYSGGYCVGNMDDCRAYYGPADYDRRHRLTVGYVWETPGFQNKQNLVGRVLGSWTVSGMVVAQSGLALTINDQRSASIYGYAPAITLATLCPGFTRSGIETKGPVSSRLNDFFNTAAFCAPPTVGDGTGIGTLGKGIVPGPGQNNWDISLARDFKVKRLGENSAFQFRTDFLNAFNHTQFAVPAGVAGVDPSLPGFGAITATSVSPRLIQFGLKYYF